MTDITEIKRSQVAVQQEKEKYNLLFQSANDMFYLYVLLPGGAFPEGFLMSMLPRAGEWAIHERNFSGCW
ncbi:hypothetical protein [Methanogenium cariaci]|uniref:hypothetical protein n=1 Tax=Methanogenium cariaci TaxID=2197 RepID=UPI000783792F|nr:hypothetical protein [Methanogenium cariaci]